jgi:Ni,Fe-hydrogenase III small subunit
LGGNPSTPVDVLRALATATDEQVRNAVGGNPSTPVDVLRSFATEPANPNHIVVDGRTVLRVLATDSDDDVGFTISSGDRVRIAVGGNPSTPVDVLRALATDSDLEVRSAVGGNPSTPADVALTLPHVCDVLPWRECFH